MNDLRQSISDNLKKIMIQSGKNQTDFSISIGVTPAALSQLINKKRTPSLESTIKICDTYKLNVDWFIGRRK